MGVSFKGEELQLVHRPGLALPDLDNLRDEVDIILTKTKSGQTGTLTMGYESDARER